MAASLRSKIKFICSIPICCTVRHFRLARCLQYDLMNSKTMKKIMRKANRQKDIKWRDPIVEKPLVPNSSVKGLPIKAKRKFSEGMQRRAKYVSEVLYEDIAQAVSSGELGVTATVTQAECVMCRFQLAQTKVKVEVIPDMVHMNIYWECTGDATKDEQTQVALTESASKLRHFLIEVQTVGNVPRPVFVKDLTLARQRQVDGILYKLSLENSAETDNEELGTSLDSSENSSEVALEMSLHDHKVNNDGKEEQVDLDPEELMNSEEGGSFRQDVYGLQHDVLMAKVLTAKESAIQRPSIVSSTENQSDNFRQFDLKLKTKSLNQNKRLSKRKLQRQLELLDNTDFDDTNFEDDISKIERYPSDESLAAIDEYIEKYSKKINTD